MSVDAEEATHKHILTLVCKIAKSKVVVVVVVSMVSYALPSTTAHWPFPANAFLLAYY